MVPRLPSYLPLRVFGDAVAQLLHERDYHRKWQTLDRVTDDADVTAVQHALQEKYKI